MIKELGLVVTGVVIGTAGTLYLTRELLGGAIAEKLIGVMEEIIDEEVQDAKDELYNEQVEKDNKRDYSKVLRRSGKYPWGEKPDSRTALNVILQTKESADKMLEHMQAITDEYGTLSINMYYYLNGISSEYEDSLYGWSDLSNVKIVSMDGGYVIQMPIAQKLNK